jgi:hypothetical protein
MELAYFIYVLFILEEKIHRGSFLWYQNKQTGQHMILAFELLKVSENAEHRSTGDLAVHFRVILDDSNHIKSQFLQEGQIRLTIFLKYLTQFTSSYFISAPRCKFSVLRWAETKFRSPAKISLTVTTSQLGSSDMSPITHWTIFSHMFGQFFHVCNVFPSILKSRIYTATDVVRGCLEGPSSKLGHRYIFVRLSVCLSTSGNKLELVPDTWDLRVVEGGAVGRVNT